MDQFLDILEHVRFVEKREYGVPPKKLVDYTPSQWVDLLSKPSKNNKVDENQ